MNLDELRSVQANERSADSLQPLREDFYREVADYIDDLRAERAEAAERSDDPFGSDAVRQLTDEIETAEDVAEAIYERRVGKVVKRASLAAAGMSVDEEGLTAEERELFADLVAEIEAHRSEVLATFGGEGGEEPPTDPAGSTSDPALDEESVSAVAGGAPDEPDSAPEFDVRDAMGGSDDEDDDEGDEAVPTETDGGTAGETASAGTDRTGEAARAAEDDQTGDRTTVRITRDVGEIFGVDERTYHLEAEDVVTLPTENAEPLVERDAAQRLE